MAGYTNVYNYTFTDHGTHMTFESGLHRHDFKQVFHYVPLARIAYPFRWEREFNGHNWVEFARNHFGALVNLAVLYIAMCFVFPLLFSRHKAIRLKWSLGLWNFALFAFSLCGAIRTVPHLMLIIYHHGLQFTLCGDISYSYAYGAAGLWSALFAYSKVFELGDTVFLVLRKRQLILLHWFHHLSVVFLCWHAMVTYSSGGLCFVAVNYCVHTVMYLYYGLMALDIKPMWFHPAIITTLQIWQLLGGMQMQLAIFYYKYIRGEGDLCHIRRSTLLASFILGSTQVSLFLEFFVLRYSYMFSFEFVYYLLYGQKPADELVWCVKNALTLDFWRSILRGEMPGPKVNTMNGVNGVNGVKDLNGFKEVNGTNSISGINGVNGIIGFKNVNGIVSANGGIKGANGISRVNGISKANGISKSNTKGDLKED